MNDLSYADPWDRVADGYETSARPVFAEFADAALNLANVQLGQNVADIACGPGTLTSLLAERGARVCAIDFSSRMLRILETNVARDDLDGVSIHHGDGQTLPFADDQFDATFSLFGLIFFPDREKGYTEMFRTLRAGVTAELGKTLAEPLVRRDGANDDAFGSIATAPNIRPQFVGEPRRSFGGNAGGRICGRHRPSGRA
jgi:ubiquinone/menaquinone biosynthesis C-methylase UbiE